MHMYSFQFQYALLAHTLTGVPTVTTPCKRTMFGCLNCPMMAASWRNLTVSFSDALLLSILTAMSRSPWSVCHTPLATFPNCPEPRCPVILSLFYIDHTVRAWWCTSIYIQCVGSLTQFVSWVFPYTFCERVVHKEQYYERLVSSRFLSLQRSSSCLQKGCWQPTSILLHKLVQWESVFIFLLLDSNRHILCHRK